ncbi:type I-U CRISPR-associated protein Csb2 [Haloechinothrix sp. LS1_15]|uniref:type I-G CRISPR-associated protein Csb2 n=1 Tax=Haloechinothrix sp. LS1_15 TaxID=2652248 RepID=UPI002945E108|nr:type I-U CRISPR-associated protein Csb2 [Haloechinothrix sp. LS1_15]MDV6011658.1 type I-U CRISPR-associated protein Cas5/Cas6 [Haloechinothrix sp. LS1_15]
MTTTLAFSFPWGRYHATPWGRHVNEGAVELPPSPWRLLRALYTVWHTRVPDLDTDTVHALLGTLAVPPMVHVPPHTIAHTRHYYPDTQHTEINLSVDQTLDTFAVFDRHAELAVQWPQTLPETQFDALSKLATSMPYLGRADSVCEARVAKEWQPDRHDTWVPVDVAETVHPEAEATTVLAPELPLVTESLVARPMDVRKGGLLFPAGTRFVGYQRARSAPKPRPRRPARKHSVTTVRFDVAQPAAPKQTEALAYTDLLRQAALSQLGARRERPEATVLGGKHADARASRTDHRHAHYLPITKAGRLTGLVVWAPDGVGGEELDAVSAIRSLRSGMRKRQSHDEGNDEDVGSERWRLTVRVAGTGPVETVAPELAGTSRIWCSLTPFTPSRYAKKRHDWQRFLRAEVERELSYRGIDARPQVELVDGNWAAYRRYRPSARMRQDRVHGQATRPSAFLRIHFDRAIGGPLALGHLSHFGLGLFVPE